MTTSCITPPTAAPIQRPTFDICPPWCAGHEDGYQRWEQGNDGVIRRFHDDHSVRYGDLSVSVGVEEVLDEGLKKPLVTITLETLDDSEATDLGDGDAHELGLAIVRAADRARRFRLDQEAGR